MTLATWQVFVAFGIPGLALGVFYALMKRFNWKFGQIDSGWAGFLALVFILVVGSVVLFAIYRFSPNQNQTSSSANPCPEQGCVDILRVADFSKSECREDGSRTDVAEFTDTFTLVNAATTDFYYARAQPDVKRGQHVELFDLSESATKPVAPSDRSCDKCASPELKWTLKVKSGVARGKWRWTNSHPDSEEGLIFDSQYRIRNIKAVYILPPGVSMVQDSKPFSSAGSAPMERCQSTRNECLGLYTDKPAYFHWRWNMWDGCPGKTQPQLPMATPFVMQVTAD